ncbi:MAG: hypothetical protein FWF21_09820 [Micrococcales bacterium]|nr:hypothetical protein [Micrococcales bacterium]
MTIAAVGAAGVVIAGLGVASATLLRPSDVLRSSVTTNSPYVVTDPGVVEMGGQPTTITVTSSKKDANLVVAVGRDSDVVAWVGDDPHQTITGTAGWSTLRISEPAAKAPSPPAEGYQSPAGSDMWVAEASGKGSAVLKSWAPGTDYPGRWSVVVANTSGAPVEIVMAWPRNVSAPWLIPALIVGLAALLWAAYQELRRREVFTFGLGHGDEAPSEEEARPRTRREARTGVRTYPVPAVIAPPPVEDAIQDAVEDDEPAPDWGPAPFAQPSAPAPEPARRSSTAKTWSRSRHAATPELDPAVAQTHRTGAIPLVPTEPASSDYAPAAHYEAAALFDRAVQPQVGDNQPAHDEWAEPPPARPGVPAWSRVSSPPPAPSPVPPPPSSPYEPRPANAAPLSRKKAARPPAPPAPPPAPAPAQSPAPSRRSRKWPPAPAPNVPEHDVAPVGGGVAAHGGTPPRGAAPAPAERRRSGPFGRRPSMADSGPSSYGPSPVAAQPPPATPSAWMPGRGARTGAIPQVPSPQAGARPAWLGQRAPAQLTGAIPRVSGPGTAPRLSAGRQSAQTPRGDAWREIWGISTEHEEDR